MIEDDEPKALGMRAAARRVGRSRRTIQRWISGGMPHYVIGGRKLILLDDLLTTWRRKILAERRNQFAKKDREMV
jgi:hypothetical protein